MARYNVSFSCSEYGRLHPTKIFLSRGKQFATRTPLAEVYKAESLPPKSSNCSATLPFVPQRETQ
jgi:hypothetical protein